MTATKHYVGLTDAQVLESRAKYGENKLKAPEKDPLWKQYLEKFGDPLIIILMITGAMAILVSCYEFWGLNEPKAVFFEPIGIFVAILLATGLAFYFEKRGEKGSNELKKDEDFELVGVIRNGNAIKIPKIEVVVGDILIVETGQEIPADAELLDSVSLYVNESTLNGESEPAYKSANQKDLDESASYPTNHLMRGTKVMEGHGYCRVFAVGNDTESGKNAKESQTDNSIKTPLNEQLDGLGDLITNLSYIFAAAIIVAKLLVYFNWAPLTLLLIIPTCLFFYLVIKKFGDWSAITCVSTIIVFFALFIGTVLWLHHVLNPSLDVSHLLAYALETVMIAVTLIVVAVPEGLPMAVTLSLAYSIIRMNKEKNKVKTTHACETMGATTVICTDKTGTLTENQMQVYEAKFYELSDGRLSDNEASKLIIENISVNSTAHLDLSNDNRIEVLGNPTEGALLLWLRSNGVNYVDYRDSVQRIAEIPFSTDRKYMAVLVNSLNDKKILYVKGAPEIVASYCKSSWGGVSPSEIDKQLVAYQEKAMRTLGFAYQIVEEEQDIETIINAHNLTFMGIVAISDPVRSDVPEAIQKCLNAGIAVKIVTGDTPGTAKEVARQIGLWDDKIDTNINIITGAELAELTDDQLKERVMDLKIIARARPLDKKRLVEALQANNQVVAVTGDGTNDAPALHAAHVGLSMGDGTKVAQDASDIIITDNSFASICNAVKWGRSLYQNIQRFLLFQLTVNVAACFIVLIGAFMGTKSPLTVTQMLWVNLIMDTFGAMALSSLPPTDKVMNDKPRKRGEKDMSLSEHIKNGSFILNNSLIANILGVGGFFFVLLLGFLYVFQHADITQMSDLMSLTLGDKNEVTTYESTLLFSIFVWTHFWYMFNARGYMFGSGLNLKQCEGFWFITSVIIIGQIVIVEVFYDFFNVEPMKWQDWLIIVGLSSLVMWIREIFRLFKK